MSDAKELFDMLQCAIDYWTPERVKEAVSISDELVESDTKIPSDCHTVCTTDKKPQSDDEECRAVPRPRNKPLGPRLESRSIDTQEDVEAELCEKTRTLRVTAESGSTDTATRSRDYVTGSEVKNLPFKSVGKLYAQRSKDKRIKDMRVTTFYIGQPTQLKESGPLYEQLLTAAHAFDDVKKSDYHNLVFAPASNPDLSDKENVYIVSDYHIHPDYSVGKSTNDLCVLFVWPWTRKEVPIRRELPPLMLSVQSGYTEEDTWVIIGYPANKNRQYYVEGSYVYPHHIENGNFSPGEMTIFMNDQAKGGMSGGPWIRKHPQYNFVVNGIQSRISNILTINGEKKLISITPYFSKKMFNSFMHNIQVVPD